MDQADETVPAEKEVNDIPTEELIETSLHTVVRSGKRKLVIELCEREQADPNAPNSKGETPLHVACLGGHVAIVQYLVKYGADTLVKDNEGNIPMICLAKTNKYKCETIAGTLINRTIDPPFDCASMPNKKGETSLMWAAKNGNSFFVRTLLQVGLDPHDKDNEGRSALDWCTDQKCRDLLEGTAV